MLDQRSLSLGEDDQVVELQSASDWDVALRYHEFKSIASLRDDVKRLRTVSARAILRRAQRILGSVTHVTERKSLSWDELPGHVHNWELDLEETIDTSPAALGASTRPITAHDLYVEYRTPRVQPIVISVDTSLSMTGEKLALTAVAIAVVLLQFPEDPIGIVAFENEAKVLKNPEERLSIQALVERFLDVPAQGYTHLEDGLKAALKQVRRIQGLSRSLRPATLLLTDGKYTAGKDPVYLGDRFPQLNVLKMGRDKSSAELCRELSKKGNGTLREIPRLESLPDVMYGMVKSLLRGRAVV